MSQSEMKRFFDDVGKDAGMKQEAESQSGGVAGIAAYAKGKGYDVTAADLESIAAQGKELSDSDLDKVAGGGIGVSVGCVFCISAS